MANLSNLVSKANESDIDRSGGELFVNINGDDAVTVKELKGLIGLEFPESHGEIKVEKINGVITSIYENIDGRFLSLQVSATFSFPGEPNSDKINDEFTIWIPEEDGASIEANDFGRIDFSADVPIGAEFLEPVISRFNL